ncbi:hypothetical protein ACFL21_01950 [Patescibacteria group bacterium]
MTSIQEIQKEIDKIKKRNKRVEIDKAWETSWARKIIILILTYFVVVLFFYFAELPDPLINAIVPAGAFVLSTLSIPLIKKLWIRNLNK